MNGFSLFPNPERAVRLWAMVSLLAASGIASASPDDSSFYVNGTEVQVFSHANPFEVLEAGASSRVVNAIATFNGAVQVVFGQMMAEMQRSGVRLEVDHSQVQPHDYWFRQRHPDIHIRQLTPSEFANWNLDVLTLAGIRPNESWLAFYVQDSGGPMAAPTLPDQRFPLRHFLGVARFQKPVAQRQFDYENHRSFGTIDVLENPEWTTSLHFFEVIGGNYVEIATGGWQGDPFNAFDWQLTNGERVRSCQGQLR